MKSALLVARKKNEHITLVIDICVLESSHVTCFIFISSNTTQLTFTCSKSTIEILQKCVKYMLKVNSKNTGTTSMSDFIKAKTGIYYFPLAVPEKVLTKVMEVIKRSLNVMQWNFHYFLHLAILGYTFPRILVFRFKKTI